MDALLAFVSMIQAAQDIPIIGPYVGPLAPWAVIAWVVDVFIIAPALPPPGPASGQLRLFIYNLVNLPAGNFGHARNFTDPKVS